jgi:hypothetical protein
MVKPADLGRYRANLRSELDGAALYRAIAQAEPDPARRAVLIELSRAETRHAAFWREKLRAAGVPEPRFSPACARGSSRCSPAGSDRSGSRVVGFCVGSSAAALAAIGGLTSLFNGRSPAFSAGRQVLFGCAAAAVTYGLGRLLGVTLS